MRGLALLSCFLALPLAVSAQYGRMDFSLQSAQGQAIAGATVNVYTQPSCGAAAGGLATLYPAATGGTPLTQPLSTDGFGSAFAYAAPGCYTVVYFSQFTGTRTFADQVPATNGASISLSTLGTGGASTLIGSLLNIPQYQSQISLTTTGTSGAATLTGAVINIPQYQCALTLTTTGTSGAATLSGCTLNIPQYTGGGGVSGQASGVIGLATNATTTGAQSHIDENTAGQDTVNQRLAVNDPSDPTEWILTPTSHACALITGAFSICPSDSLSSGSALQGPDAPGSGDQIIYVTNTAGVMKIKFVTPGPGLSFSGGTLSAPFSCQPGLGDGLNAIAAGTYLQSTCKNTSGVTITIHGIQCFTDNNGSSTMNVTNGAGTGLLTGAVTCSNSFAAGTQSGTTTIASGDYFKFTFVADGTSKQTTWVIF
ncbi:MAG TPA: hypothetical protein VFB43_18025 [Terracidiphilus sp.]|nr:hypothetical protein [Terracidiphilus sp.]